MSVTTVGSREARQKWRDLLDAAYLGTNDTIIERNGKAVAVLIPYEDYLALEETLDELRSARRAAGIYKDWKANPDQGQPYPRVREALDRQKRSQTDEPRGG